MQNIQSSTIPLPITQGAFKAAQSFSQHQPSLEKKSQIHLNILAVCAVNDYLRMINVATDLTASDSWNPVFQYCSNVADLALPDLGHLECRPVLPRESNYTLPFETPDNRIGTVVVEIDETQRRATLLGFSKALTPGTIPVKQLQPIDDLLIQLEALEQKLSTASVSVSHLSEWFNGLFETGWQTVKTALGREPGMLALGFRTVAQQESLTTVTRAKLLDLGIKLGNQQVVLLIIASDDQQDQMEIRAQLHPTMESTYLPPNLKLSLLSHTGETLQEVPSRNTDNLIQLPSFQCNRGEPFQLQIALDDIVLTESFIT